MCYYWFDCFIVVNVNETKNCACSCAKDTPSYNLFRRMAGQIEKYLQSKSV